MVSMIEVKRYRKPDGYPSRYWAVYVDGELLAVVLYRKGAMAIADLILNTRAGKAASDAA
jgi:hypothetical protein